MEVYRCDKCEKIVENEMDIRRINLIGNQDVCKKCLNELQDFFKPRQDVVFKLDHEI